LSAPTPADAIVVAAGSSSRMGGIDKLERTVAGRPILAWSIDAIAAVDDVDRIVVVTAAERREAVARAPWLHAKVADVVVGGGRRHESVAAGLVALVAHGGAPEADGRVVLVHDGARPLASAGLVRAVLDAAREVGAAIPILPVAETVKRVEGGRVVGTVDRSELATAQTPQGVRRGLLRAAFERFPPTGEPTWTDEAALLEACRIPVHAIPGEAGNLKVTLPADLDRVRAVLEPGSRADGPDVRVGFGSDSHPFGPGEPLVLGGVSVPGGFRLAGHSDGDVVLHAVADALLGAAGLGDLGRIFPAGPATPAGIASAELLADVVRRVVESGHRAVSVDVTIVAARPRLAGHLAAMAATIAQIVGVQPDAVNVKASTGNLDGMEGAGRGISAQAVATLARTR
jgi:2-C-methyl-D-erythritol 4-phosphate cytidylyltransferase/2-C-methyl-D-erythritol 2,4-cyclodiphosphate synthase